jgi:hypothetical protein
MAQYFVQKEVILVKSTHFNVLNTRKYRQIFAGIGIWSPEYRYSGIGIFRIGNTIHDGALLKLVPTILQLSKIQQNKYPFVGLL